jgi:hypothetical protein
LKFVDPSVEVELERNGDLVLVHLDNNGQILIEDNTHTHGRAVGALGEKTIQILRTLQSENGLSVQYFLKWISGSSPQGPGQLHLAKWHRIVLDEGKRRLRPGLVSVQ